MKNRDLIKLLLDHPMDMPVLMGLPSEVDDNDIECWDLNTAVAVEHGEKGEEKKIIMLFWNNEPDANLN